MVTSAVALFLLIRRYGERLTAPASGASLAVPAPLASAPVPRAAPNVVFHGLLALAAVIVIGRLLGTLLARVRQPPVIGEVLAGILLGPSLLGRLA
jgi:hypothetical protein